MCCDSLQLLVSHLVLQPIPCFNLLYKNNALLHYNVKKTSLSLKQILKQSHGFQVNEASDVKDHVLLAKQIKLRYSSSM